MVLKKRQGIYRQKGRTGVLYVAVRQILARGSTREPRKRGYGRVSTAIVRPRAACCVVLSCPPVGWMSRFWVLAP